MRGRKWRWPRAQGRRFNSIKLARLSAGGRLVRWSAVSLLGCLVARPPGRLVDWPAGKQRDNSSQLADKQLLNGWERKWSSWVCLF